MARAWLFSVPRNCQNLSFLGSRYKGSEKVPPTMQQHCIALWRQWCVAAPNNLQVKWGQNLYEFENKIEFLTFWSSELASSFRSNWTNIWTSNSNGTWTDKHSSQFSTAKEMSVKATFFYVKTTTNKFWNDAEMMLKSFWTSHLQMMNWLEPLF